MTNSKKNIFLIPVIFGGFIFLFLYLLQPIRFAKFNKP